MCSTQLYEYTRYITAAYSYQLLKCMQIEKMGILRRQERTKSNPLAYFSILFLTSITLGFLHSRSLVVNFAVPTGETWQNDEDNHDTSDYGHEREYRRDNKGNQGIGTASISSSTTRIENDNELKEDQTSPIPHGNTTQQPAILVKGSFQTQFSVKEEEQMQKDLLSSLLQREHQDTPYTPEEGRVPTGILSSKSKAFFENIRREIDNIPITDRCEPYSFPVNNTAVNDDDNNMTSSTNIDNNVPANRRIFFGSLLADEPQELLEIVAAETYNIFTGIVFVESNRTQHFAPRPLQRQGQEEAFKDLFGAERVQVRSYVNEDPRILDLAREHEARQEILRGWKDLGMTKNDIGYIADADETFTRDFLRAIQTCPFVPAMDYDMHRCDPRLALVLATSRVFESSPDCITKKRTWHRPSLLLGRCMELIGDSSIHPVSPREGLFIRAKGFGQTCDEDGFKNIRDGNFPLFSAADLRRQCGGKMVRNQARGKSEYTGFHFHNFVANFKQTRFKYKTYGHPQNDAFEKKLEDIHEDLELVARCVHNVSNDEGPMSSVKHNQRHQVEEAGLQGTPLFWPVYFFDDDYRERKRHSLRQEFLEDEVARQAREKTSSAMTHMLPVMK